MHRRDSLIVEKQVAKVHGRNIVFHSFLRKNLFIRVKCNYVSQLYIDINKSSIVPPYRCDEIIPDHTEVILGN